MPNYFGEQRFGRRGNNDRLGAALLRGDAEAVIRLLLGGPDPAVDDAEAIKARTLFDGGDRQAALDAWPRRDRDERAALVRFIRTGDAAAAIAAVGEPVRRLWVSALQSRVFNDVVARRINDIDGLLDGDVAYKHDNGACFAVTDAAAERPRAAAFEISATGPLVGPSMLRPINAAAVIEEAVIDAAQVTIPADARGDFAPGARRPLRVPAKEIHAESGMDANGPYILTAFTLPPGAYATVPAARTDAERLTAVSLQACAASSRAFRASRKDFTHRPTVTAQSTVIAACDPRATGDTPCLVNVIASRPPAASVPINASAARACIRCFRSDGWISEKMPSASKTLPKKNGISAVTYVLFSEAACAAPAKPTMVSSVPMTMAILGMFIRVLSLRLWTVRRRPSAMDCRASVC